MAAHVMPGYVRWPCTIQNCKSLLRDVKHVRIICEYGIRPANTIGGVCVTAVAYAARMHEPCVAHPIWGYGIIDRLKTCVCWTLT